MKLCLVSRTVLLLGCSCVGGTLSTSDASATDRGVPTDQGVAPEVGPADVSGEVPADAGMADVSTPDALPPDAGAPVDPLAGRGTPEVIASGYVFVEGPLWHDGGLLFSDIPANRIYRWTESDGVRVFREPSAGSNGLARSANGQLYAAEHGGRQVSVRAPGASAWTALVARHEGARFNSPNDLIVRSDGVVYFTDPEWGILGDLSARELSFNGLFRYRPGGTTSVEWQANWQGHPDTPRPNGVTLSPDERTLYMAEDRGAAIYVFDVAADGALTERSQWATAPTPDGLTVDLAGNLYVGTARGVEVYAPAGTRWGLIPLSGAASNVAFGGDGRDLFVTSGTEVLRIRLTVMGRR